MRIVLDILLVISVIMLPWWCALAVALVLLAMYEAYEVVFVAMLFDLLYGRALPPYLPVPILVTALAGVVFLSIEAIKPHLSFYSRR